MQTQPAKKPSYFEEEAINGATRVNADNIPDDKVDDDADSANKIINDDGHPVDDGFDAYEDLEDDTVLDEDFEEDPDEDKDLDI